MKKIILIFTVLFVGFLLLPNIIFSQWKKVNAPVHSQCFAIQNNNIFVGTPDSGVFISTDNGIIWNQVNNGLPGLYISDIFAINENLFSIVNGKNSNLYFSTNNGAEWIEVNNELTENHQSIASHIASDGKVIVSTRGPYGSIYYSKDNCETWIKSSGYDSSIYYIDVFFASGTNIFALEGIGNDIYLSTNDGMSWTKIESDLAFNKKINDDGVITISGIGGNLFLGTGDGIYISTNNGVNWLEEDSKLAGLEVNTFFVSDTNIIAGTSNGAYLSTNNGINWSKINYGFGDNNPNIRKFYFAEGYLYELNRGYGVWRCALDDILSEVLENSWEFINKIDYDLISYIEKENEFIKSNKIKSIKREGKKEYYNAEGELTKIEFGEDEVWGVVDIVKKGDNYYFKCKDVMDNFSDDKYSLAGRGFFINKLWPYRQTIVYSEYILNWNRIEVSYTFYGDTRYIDFYIYNENDKIDKILSYMYSYDISYPSFMKDPNQENKIDGSITPFIMKDPNQENKIDGSITPKNENRAVFNNKNIAPELTNIQIYHYDNSGKLISIEDRDIKENKSNIRNILYNERGLEIQEGWEYEYYDESELNDYNKDIKK